MTETLTGQQAVILQVAKEVSHLPDDGTRERRASTLSGMGYVPYLQILNGLLDNPAALAAEPVLVNRLRRIREDAEARRGRRLPGWAGSGGW